MKAFLLLSIFFLSVASSTCQVKLVPECFRGAKGAYINFASAMIAGYENTINGANHVFPSLENSTAMEQLKAWPNLINQFSSVYEVCKDGLEQLADTLHKLAAYNYTKNYPVIIFTQSVLLKFHSGINTIIAADNNFLNSVDNLNDVTDGIINDPATSVIGEDIKTTHSSLIELGNAFAALENGNRLISQGNQLMYNTDDENQLLSVQRFPQSKALFKLVYSNMKSLYQYYGEIANLVQKQYQSYVQMDNMMNMDPNAKMGTMCQKGTAIIIGNTSQAVVTIMEKLLNSFVAFKNGLENLS